MLGNFLKLHGSQCGWTRVGEGVERLDLGSEREESGMTINVTTWMTVVKGCRKKNLGGN